jgi:phage terminase large subunit-like protein
MTVDIKKLGEQKAQEAVDFFQSLKLTKGKFHGCYFDLQDWQDKIVRDIYGTLKPDGTRQYKMAYIEIPKKQGKSEMAAGFALKQLCADGEWMGEVYGCAADKSNASQVFDVAVEMIEQEPELKSQHHA